jgi:hypothetical protein
MAESELKKIVSITNLSPGSGGPDIGAGVDISELAV